MRSAIDDDEDDGGGGDNRMMVVDVNIPIYNFCLFPFLDSTYIGRWMMIMCAKLQIMKLLTVAINRGLWT